MQLKKGSNIAPTNEIQDDKIIKKKKGFTKKIRTKSEVCLFNREEGLSKGPSLHPIRVSFK